MADLYAHADGIARLLRDAGVGAERRVGVMMASDHRFIACWFGIHLAGAVEVPYNLELRGLMLAHVLEDSEPLVVLCDAEHEELLRPALRGCSPQTRLIVIDDAALRIARSHDPGTWADPRPSALASILYTSGTTGPSKGVMLPHGYFPNHGAVLAAAHGLDRSDVLYLPMPFFHIDGHTTFVACLVSGACMTSRPRFSVSEFWNDIIGFGATWFGGVGSMLSLVARHQPVPPRSSIPLRMIYGGPIPPKAYAFFEDELGLPVHTVYGQTESAYVTLTSTAVNKRGTTGGATSGFDVAILDTDGQPVPRDTDGEIVYRPNGFNHIMMGYWKRPDATAAAWRGLWFHTGDIGRIDDDDCLVYAGRLTDSLRRRGENVSVFELENAIRTFPGIVDCAARPVRDPVGSENEILMLIELSSGTCFDADAFFARCDEELPRYARPRFVEVLEPEVITRGPGGAMYKHDLPSEVGPHTIERPGAR